MKIRNLKGCLRDKTRWLNPHSFSHELRAMHKQDMAHFFKDYDNRRMRSIKLFGDDPEHAESENEVCLFDTVKLGKLTDEKMNLFEEMRQLKLRIAAVYLEEQRLDAKLRGEKCYIDERSERYNSDERLYWERSGREFPIRLTKPEEIAYDDLFYYV